MARAHLRKSVPTHTRIASIRQQPRPEICLVVPSEKRNFSRLTWLALPRKDSQDRESIDRESTEYSKSGTDDEAAGLDQAAFDPNTTEPGAEKNAAGKVSNYTSTVLRISARFEAMPSSVEPHSASYRETWRALCRFPDLFFQQHCGWFHSTNVDFATI